MTAHCVIAPLLKTSLITFYEHCFSDKNRLEAQSEFSNESNGEAIALALTQETNCIELLCRGRNDVPAAS